jgi:orotate phosphoribosyltransferase
VHYPEETQARLIEAVKQYGHRHFEEPVELASGELSHDFLDCKKALQSGHDLALASEAVVQVAASLGIEFDAVGGLTLGADPLTFGISLVSGCKWFVVRKKTKGRGTNELIEGCELIPDTRVLLVDDVATTGGSILQAYEAVVATGATVVLATVVADRGELATARFGELGIPYQPLMTYRDLDIAPVRGDGNLQPA